MKKKSFLFITLSLVFALMLSGCGFSGSKKSSSEKGNEKSEKVLNLSLENDIPDLNQVKTTDGISFRILNNVMEGLYRVDENSEPQPAMAESVDISDDKLTYTFHLRDGIKWSNGDPVTAQDFKYSWLRALNPDTAGAYADILYNYIVGAEEYANGKGEESAVGIEAKDDQTLIVKLKKPTPFFLGLTAFVTYFPLNEKFIKEVGEDKFALSADAILFNGPFVLTDYDQAKGVSLKKNDQYWDKDSVKLDKANLKVIKEQSTALNLYESGQLDKVYLSSSDVNNYKDNKEFGTETGFSTYFIQFNFDKAPFDNDNIRKAFQLAYDPKVLTDTILNNGSKPAYGLIPTGMHGTFREDNGDIVKTDVAKAKELLAKGVKEVGKLPHIEVLTSDDTVSKDTATFLQSEFKKNLGVDVDIVTKPYSGRLDAMRAGEFQLGINRWGADFNDAINYLDLWVGEPATPLRGSFFDKQYNELIAKSIEEKDDQKRLDMLMEAEKLMLDKDAAIGPLYYDGKAFLQNSKVKGLVIHPYGPSLELKGVTIN